MGTKLQVIITKLGLRIAERGDVVKGTPVVEPANDLFWFNRPHLILFLINFVLFLVFLSYIYSIYLCLILSGSHNTMAHSNYAYATSVLFLKSQNAFQLAFFAWSTVSNWLKPLSFLPLIFGVSHGLFFPIFQYEFGLQSCYHQKTEDIAIRISMGWASSQHNLHILRINIIIGFTNC